jgi:hypothetical protein
MPDRYAAYPSLELERPAEGVLRVVMRAPMTSIPPRYRVDTAWG